MITALAHLRRRRASGGAQSGFALATALAVLLVTSVLVAALLSLTFATTGFSGAQVRRDADTRASDGALEAAVAEIARDDSGNLGALVGGGVPSNDCNWLPSAGQTEADRPVAMTVDVDGRQVEVKCTAEAPERGFVPEDEQNKDWVYALGSYDAPASPVSSTGRLWKTTAAECREFSTNCYPWTEALANADISQGLGVGSTQSSSAYTGSVGSTSFASPGILHTGSDALWFVGNARSVKGAATLRNPERDCTGGGSCSYQAQSPGMGVSGRYYQGTNGLLSTAPGAVAPCGILTTKGELTDDSSYLVPGAQVSAQGGANCDDAATRQLDAGSSLVPAAPVKWTPAVVRGSDRATSPPSGKGDWSNSCPSGRVVQFSPGAYTKNLTRVMNTWFRNCSNKVFYFPPGNYWIDVDDPAARNAADPGIENALVFSNNSSQTNLYVFGTPNTTGGNANALFRDIAPNLLANADYPTSLCNPDAAGVTLTLSARTTLRHLNGSVAICGARSGGQALPAIWQDGLPELGYSAGPTLVDGGMNQSGIFNIFGWGGFNAVLNFFGLNTNFQVPITSTTPPFQLGTTCILGCQGEIGFGMSFTPAGTTPEQVPDANVNSAMVVLNGEQWRANDSNTSTRFDVFLYGESTPACSVTYPRILDDRKDTFGGGSKGKMSVAYDLLDPNAPVTPGFQSCANRITKRSQLLTAAVVAKMKIDSTGVGGSWWVRVDSAALRTVWRPQATTVSCSVVSTSGRPAGSCSGAEAVLDTNNLNTLNSGKSMSDGGGNLSGAGFSATTFPRGCTGNAPWWLGGFCWSWGTAGGGTTAYTLSNLNDLYEPNLASAGTPAPLTSAGVLVKGRSFCNTNFLGLRRNCASADVANDDDAKVRVELRNANNTVACAAEYRRLPEWYETRFLDLFASTGGSVLSNTCKSWIEGQPAASRTNALFVGRSLVVSMVMDRRENFFGFFASETCNLLNGCYEWGYRVDYIGLATTSEAPCGQNVTANCPGGVESRFSGPIAPVRITSNDARGTQADARFNSYGPIALPKADLDMRWSGPRTPEPVFTGRRSSEENQSGALVVNAISSDMTRASTAPELTPRTGVLCCAAGRPAERVVKLQAFVEGELTAYATVRIDDMVPNDPDNPEDPMNGTWEPGQAVYVDEWRLCRSRTGDESCPA